MYGIRGRHHNFSNLTDLNGCGCGGRMDGEGDPTLLETIFGAESGQAIGNIGLTIDGKTALTLFGVIVGGLTVSNFISKQIK